MEGRRGNSRLGRIEEGEGEGVGEGEAGSKGLLMLTLGERKLCFEQ
jgi:hypothetical protein